MIDKLFKKWYLANRKNKLVSLSTEIENPHLINHEDTMYKFGVAGLYAAIVNDKHELQKKLIRKIIKSHSEHILRHFSEEPSVVVGHNNSKVSSKIAKYVAKTYKSNGVEAYLFEDNSHQITPVVSFAIKKLKLSAGIYFSYDDFHAKTVNMKFLNEHGSLVNVDVSRIIERELSMDYADYSVDIDASIKRIKKEIAESYIYQTSKIAENSDGIDISIQTDELLNDDSVYKHLLAKRNIVFKTYKNVAMNNHSGFSHSNKKNLVKFSLTRLKLKARDENANIGALINSRGDSTQIAARSSKFNYHHLTSTDLATWLLHFKLRKMSDEGKLDEKCVVVVSSLVPQSVVNVCESFNVRMVKTSIGTKNLFHFINHNPDLNVVMAYQANGKFTFDTNIVGISDSNQVILMFSNAYSYMTSQNISLENYLEELHERYGETIEHSEYVKLNLLSPQVSEIIRFLKSIRTINNVNISKKITLFDSDWVGRESIGITIIMEDNTKIHLKKTRGNDTFLVAISVDVDEVESIKKSKKLLHNYIRSIKYLWR